MTPITANKLAKVVLETAWPLHNKYWFDDWDCKLGFKFEIIVAIGCVDAESEFVNVVNCAWTSDVIFFNLSNTVAETLFILVVNSID